MKAVPTPHRSEDALLAQLNWLPITERPDAPTHGDVIMYRDGTTAFVGSSSQVSYGERAQMQTVARLWPLPAQQQEEDEATAHALEAKPDILRKSSDR